MQTKKSNSWIWILVVIAIIVVIIIIATGNKKTDMPEDVVPVEDTTVIVEGDMTATEEDATDTGAPTVTTTTTVTTPAVGA